MRPHPSVAVAFALAALFLTGCGISDYTLQFAAETKGQIEHRKEGVETSQRDLTAFLASDESIGYRSTAQNEQWEARVAAGRAKVEEAEKLFEYEIQGIIDLNDSTSERHIFDHAERISAMLAESREESEFWRTRARELSEAQDNAETMHNGARAAVAEIQGALQGIQTRAAATKREFPEQAAAIDQITGALASLTQGVQGSLANVQRQYQAHASGAGADYGVLATEYASIERSRALATQGVATAEARFAELSRSYAKTLTDMKAEYSLTIRRQSWDDSAEYPGMHDYDFKRMVEGPTFEHFEAIPGTLATVGKGWFSDDFSIQPGVEQARWDELKIDPKESWTDGDSHAELWLESGEAKYFHKYHIVDNGETSETDWVEVDEELFFANLENLGMDVEVKPYGVFEQDKLTHASPPGMGFVGNPRYGRWENQAGGSVWTWVAPYLFYRTLFGNPWMYNRNEWSTWRSGYYRSRPYYGSSGPSTPMYGTRSSRTQTSPTLSASQYGRSGGFSRPSGTVRGSGPSSRGGGFGGSGK